MSLLLYCIAHHVFCITVLNCASCCFCCFVCSSIISVDKSKPVDVPGSPFTISVAPKPLVDALHSSGSGIGLQQSVEGYTTAFQILLRDAYSNPISAQQVRDWSGKTARFEEMFCKGPENGGLWRDVL